MNANWGEGLKATLPADAGSNPFVGVSSVSCPSAGNCAAVGNYTDNSSNQQGLLLTETSGAWAAAKAPLPASANSIPGVFVTSVSCASVGNCAAVGSFLDGFNHTQGLLLTEASGVWSAVKANLPADAGSDPTPLLSSVSCSSAGNCVAVGDYFDNSNHLQGVVLTASSGTWSQGVEVAPPNAAANPAVGLGAVSCSSDGNCAVVGEFQDSSSNVQGLLLTETSGSWTAAAAALPAHAAANPGVSLTSVSCASGGNCTAVGSYTDDSNNPQGLLLTEASGVWGPGVKASLPADAGAQPGVILTSVSCASAGDCGAVGTYYDDSFNQHVVLLDESSGNWDTGVEASLPANAGTSPSIASALSVSCASAGNCSAVGGYLDNVGPGNQQGLLLTESSGTWQQGVEAGMPTGAASNPLASLYSASCVSAANCSAVGIYTDSSSDFQGLLLSSQAATPTLTATAPSTLAFGSTLDAGSISADLSGGASPTGTITFTVFARATAPSSCDLGGHTVGTASVSANGTYHPDQGFAPKQAGDYWWYASYSGDASDNPAASTCGAGMAETVVAGPPTAQISSPSSGGTYAVGQSVATSFSCTEGTGGPGIASCADNNGGSGNSGHLDTSTPGAHTYTVTATSSDGQTANTSITYTVAAAPSAHISSPASGGTYAVGQLAATSFSCTEGSSGPGISTCVDSNGATGGSGHLDTSTTGSHTYTVTATSSDGQTGHTSITYAVAAAPSAQISSPSSGGTYTAGQSVATSFSCTEGAGGPGISSCTDNNAGSGTSGHLDTSTPGAHTYTVTATSSDGQTAHTSISYTVAAAPPLAHISSPAGGATYAVKQSVATSFSCTDGAGGPGISSCADSNGGTGNSGHLDTSAPGQHTYTVTATSTDGQTAQTSISYTVAGAPSVEIIAPADGSEYAHDQKVDSKFTCLDGAYGPGIATCVDDGNKTSGNARVDTSKAGKYSFTVTATSSDGQVTTKTIHYTVLAPPPSGGPCVPGSSRNNPRCANIKKQIEQIKKSTLEIDASYDSIVASCNKILARVHTQSIIDQVNALLAKGAKLDDQEDALLKQAEKERSVYVERATVAKARTDIAVARIDAAEARVIAAIAVVTGG